MAAYLAISAVPVQISLRYTLEDMVAGTQDPPNMFSMPRHVVCTCVPMVGSVAIAASYPSYAEKIFAATGALPVCLICYVIPVWLHVVLYWRGVRRRSEGAGEGLLEHSRDGGGVGEDTGVEDGGDDGCTHERVLAMGRGNGVFQHVVVPVCVAVGMTGISAVAFWRSVKAFWMMSEPGEYPVLLYAMGR